MMILAVKTGIIICVLTTVTLWSLWNISRPDLRDSEVTAARSTLVAFAFFCSHVAAIAFSGIIGLVAYFTRNRRVAAGISLFLLITLPSVSVVIMAGSLQLITFSTASCVIIGLLAGSLFWQRRNSHGVFIRDYPVYVLVLVLIFIAARGTTFTNILRVFVENVILFVVPYLLVRRSLIDSDSIRNTFLLITAAGLAVSLVAIFESFMVWPIYNVYAQTFDTLVAAVKMRGGMLRAAGPLLNPPLSSAVLAFCFVSAFVSRDLFRNRSSHIFVLLVISVGLFSMQARVGWLGAAVGSLAVIISRRGAKAFVSYIPLSIVALASIYGATLFNESFANLVGFSSDAKGSSEYRNRLANLGLEIVKAHPLIGQPIPQVEKQMISLKQGEGIVDFVNGYLSVALFSGLIGLSLFASAFFVQFLNARASRLSARRQGAGSFADFGLGIVLAGGAMFPFVPTDNRVLLTMILLFALSNSMINHFRGHSSKS